MICHDWRDAPAGDVAALYDAERARWMARLAWDITPALAIVEQGRLGGHVPGWIAQGDDGQIHGWTYYVLHKGILQIGGLSVSRPAATRPLIDAILQSPEAGLAQRLSCFVFPDGRSTASALERQRFALGETRYLLRAAGDAMPSDSSGVRPWRESDLAPAVKLLAGAYQGVAGAACFAPDGSIEEWAHYVLQLTRVPACGAFDPSLSVVVPAPTGIDLHGAALVTRISSTTAHLAQIAVSPAVRRTGLARTLLASVFASCAAAGLETVTLMVDSRNTSAATLYTDLGFTERARFLYGARSARVRVAA